MSVDDQNPRNGLVRGITSFGGRAAARTVRPLTGVVGAATDAGLELERRVFDHLIENGELERLLNSERIHAAVQQILESEGTRRLVDAFFDSSLFDHILERVLSSPAVTTALSQQGLSYADQLGDALRVRSRKADAWVERRAGGLRNRPSRPS